MPPPVTPGSLCKMDLESLEAKGKTWLGLEGVCILLSLEEA